MYIFVTSILSISCIILHMVKLFHIKIRKISFGHNSSIKVNNPQPPKHIILTLRVDVTVKACVRYFLSIFF